MADAEIYVHTSAIIDPGCSIGNGTKIWHFSHISTGSSIGKNCKIRQNDYVAQNVRIGDSVKIQNNVSLYEGVVLEDNVFCGPSVVFTNVRTPRSEYPRNSTEHFHRTLVKRCASIGANATIVCGSTIGEYAFVGAGCVVNRDVPPHAVVVGVPARRIGWACECGPMLKFSADTSRCRECGKLYALTLGELKRIE